MQHMFSMRKVQHLHESYFLPAFLPAEVQRHVSDSLLTHQLARDITYAFTSSWARYKQAIVQSISNFIWKLWMIREGSFLVLSHGVKGHVQLCTLYVEPIVSTIQATVFARTLSNSAWKCLIIKGGTILIVDHGIKGPRSIWHSIVQPCAVMIQTIFFVQTIFNFICKLSMMI